MYVKSGTQTEIASKDTRGVVVKIKWLVYKLY